MECTFLEMNEIKGENQLEIFKRYGTKAKVTDYAIATGVYVDDSICLGNTSLENRTGWYWTKTPDGDNDARAVSFWF